MTKCDFVRLEKRSTKPYLQTF